jgi:hypothetical protein
VAGEISAEELAALVDQIDRGEDPYQLPEVLVEEPEPASAPRPAPLAPEELIGGEPVEPKVNESLYIQIMRLTVGEKIKLALKGNRDARNILIRDASHIVPRFVMQNPRITDDEIVSVSRNRNIDADVLRIIGDDKEWGRNPQIRSALVANPKTPIAVALKFVNSLSERELRLLAKSKNIPSAVAGSAKRVLLARTGH